MLENFEALFPANKAERVLPIAAHIPQFREPLKPELAFFKQYFESFMLEVTKDIQGPISLQDLRADLYQTAIRVSGAMIQRCEAKTDIGGNFNLGVTVSTLAFHDMIRLFEADLQLSDVDEVVIASGKLCDLLTTVDLDTCAQIERALGLMDSAWKDSRPVLAEINNAQRGNSFARKTGAIDIIEAVKPRISEILGKPNVQPGYCPAQGIIESYLRIVGEVSKRVIVQNN